jgi:SAM-dependent methyltransferase
MDGSRAVMFDASAEYYDLIYATLKDYPREASQIAALLRGIDPRCRTVLDVACGTGEHARLLGEAGFVVDGLDASEAFVTLAGRKHLAGQFFKADMSHFDLGRRYDAVLCLFSSIGYLVTLDRVEKALTCFRRHLAPSGVVVVEPWFEPGGLDPTRVARNTGEEGGVHVTRVSRVEVEDRVSRLHFDYEITDQGGTRHASEVHELGLFTTAELLEAFRKAEFRADHDPEGLTGRGLFIARPAAEVQSRARL